MSVEYEAIFGIGVKVKYKPTEDVGDTIEYLDSISDYKFFSISDGWSVNPVFEYFLVLNSSEIEENTKENLDKLVSQVKLDKNLEIIGEPGIVGGINIY